MIGKFSKRVLLTGAGGRETGAPARDEVWSSSIASRTPRQRRLRDLLMKRPLSCARQDEHPTVCANDRTDLQQAGWTLVRWIAKSPVYRTLDQHLQSSGTVFRFFGQRNEGNTAGYLFTLNQDLFFERHLYTNMCRCAWRRAAGLLASPGQPWFGTNIGLTTRFSGCSPSPTPRPSASDSQVAIAF